MKRNLFLSLTAVLILAGCDYNDKYFDGLDDSTQPTDVKKIEYTLTEEDYATIAGNSTNKSIAKQDNDSAALSYLKSDKYFSENLSSAKYIPAFLSNKYYTADAGSSAKITFNYKEGASALHKPYYGMEYLKLAAGDYKAVHGEGYYANYLNSSTTSKLYKALNAKYKEAKEGDVVFAEYNYNQDAKPEKMEDPVYTFDFESLKENTDVTSAFNGWFVESKGEKVWQAKIYDDNKYIQFSANGAKGEEEAWLVTPTIKIEKKSINLAFEVKVGYYNGDCLSVLISEDFDGKNLATAQWDDVTDAFAIPKEPAKGYGDNFVSAGKYLLDAYEGKDIRIAFRYTGNGDKADLRTTTYQIDNLVVGKDIPKLISTVPQYAVWCYGEKGWNALDDENVLVLTPEDYAAMGAPAKNMNFSSSILADNYLPSYLAKTVAYPVDEDAKVVIYRYYDGKQTSARSDEYIYSSQSARWVVNNHIVTKTEQYVLSDAKWNFNPSTVITLKADKSDAEATTFYTAIVAWVRNNQKEFVTTYDNNEYYYGSSFYQNNFDFRVSAWRDYYKGKSEEEIKKIMWDRLPEAFIRALESLYADADMVSGIDVIYTINFAIYEGTNPAPTYTIKYKVVGKGKFEYIEDSLQKQE